MDIFDYLTEDEQDQFDIAFQLKDEEMIEEIRKVAMLRFWDKMLLNSREKNKHNGHEAFERAE